MPTPRDPRLALRPAARSGAAAAAMTAGAPAHALGANMNDDGIGWLLLAAAGLVVLWLVIAWSLARVIVRRFTTRKRWHWLAAALLALSPLSPLVVGPVWTSVDAHVRQSGIDRRARDANEALARACAARAPRPAARPVIVGADGLDVIPASTQLALDGRPPGAADDLEALQFDTPLAWAAQAGNRDLGREAGFSFIEAEDVDDPDRMSVVAPARWWRNQGHRRSSPSDWIGIEDLLEDPQPDWVHSGVYPTSRSPSQARYVLTLTDVSTRDDRAHWLARGRMRLVDRRGGQVVAEYVGLSANQVPGFPPRPGQEGSGAAWESTRECDGPERRYADGTARWQALAFFFGEVVQVK